MTTTVDTLRDFLADDITQAFTDPELEMALAAAKDYLTKRGITVSGYTGDRITVIQAALFATTKTLKTTGTSGTSGTAGTIIEGGAITEIRDGDTVVKYSETSVQGATSGTAATAATTAFRTAWQTELDELILLSDDCILADYMD